jgi:hypothetical protein
MNAIPPVFDRAGSTLGVMDDLQIAVHSYDGCSRGCSGCLVDKHFKNKRRGAPILSERQFRVVDSRVREYYDWVRTNLNTKDTGYFGTNGYKVSHRSYTHRFGNHAELPVDDLVMMATVMPAEFRVLSIAAGVDLDVFAELKKRVPGNYYLEIIYDPVVDSALTLRQTILDMRAIGILGYPEVLVTRRLVDAFPPRRFVDEALGPVSDIGTQLQFGRYTPSRTRGFNRSQLIPIDEEVEWLTAVSRLVVQRGYDIHPIPLGEYGVTLLDEYGEAAARRADGSIDESLLPEPQPLDIAAVREKTRDIFLSSLYIDHKLDLYVWSESVGQHVLDNNLGFAPLGNIEKEPIHEIVTRRNGGIDRLLAQVMRSLLSHPKCAPCRYKSFCASHAVPLFRKFQDDAGKHCYGYIPVIREFQRDVKFLGNMVEGFKSLGF